MAAISAIVLAFVVRELWDSRFDSQRSYGSIGHIPYDIAWAASLLVLFKFVFNEAVFVARLEALGLGASAGSAGGTPSSKLLNAVDLSSRLFYLFAAACAMQWLPAMFEFRKDVSGGPVTYFAIAVVCMTLFGFVIPTVDFLYWCRYRVRCRPARASGDRIKRVVRVVKTATHSTSRLSLQGVAEFWVYLNWFNLVAGVALLVMLGAFYSGWMGQSQLTQLTIWIWCCYTFVNVFIDLVGNRAFFFGDEMPLVGGLVQQLSSLEYRFLRPFIPWIRSRTQRLDSIFEIGCGFGELAWELARRATRVCAIDKSAGRIAVARSLQRHRRPPEFMLGDFMEIDLTAWGKSFDVVVATFVLHDLDYDRALTRIKSILRPDGRLLVFDIYRGGTRRRSQDSAGSLSGRVAREGNADLDEFGSIYRYVCWRLNTRRLYRHRFMLAHLRSNEKVILRSLDQYDSLFEAHFTDVQCYALTNRIFAAQLGRMKTV